MLQGYETASVFAHEKEQLKVAIPRVQCREYYRYVLNENLVVQLLRSIFENYIAADSW